MFSGSGSLSEIPADTAQAARRIYNVQHVYVRIGDELGRIQNRSNLSLLDSTASLDADAALRLALVSAFQYAEDLPDPAAAVATTKRMDWKYALHLPVRHPGIPASALCHFRQNLLSFPHRLKEYSNILEQLGEFGLFTRPVSGGGVDPLESLTLVCMITRLQNLKLRVKVLISTLAATAPDWMRANALPHWYSRYSTSALGYPSHPTIGALEREALAIGADIKHLFSRLPQAEDQTPACQNEVERIAALWGDEFVMEGNTIRWRMPGCSTCVCNHLGEMDQ